MNDYHRIAEAINFIVEQADSQPTLEQIAAHLHISPYHFQRLFSRWVGVTPKRFLQVLTLEHAKQLLRESSSLLEVSDSLGLSSGSRLYDHFVQLQAVTPGEFKLGGEGLCIEYGIHETPFGSAFIATTPRGICKFSFVDFVPVEQIMAELADCWPRAVFIENQQATASLVAAMFNGQKSQQKPLSLHVSGTNFQVSVWRALLEIPPAMVTSYTQIAKQVGRPRAARAVGTAIGANPVAFVIPCHRVIQQSGKLAGYHWGETRKQAMHAWEAARYGEQAENSSADIRKAVAVKG